MYKVVLIDDEQIIVDGLCRVVKWAEYGCEVAGTACNAQDGAELIRRERPHILFTDIRMPGQTGLTMLAGLRSEFPQMQVTVLTGYRDFAYGQEAVRLGVTRLLCKPSRMSEINEALAAMTERLSVIEAESRSGAREERTLEDDHAGHFIVRQAMEYLQEHYRERISLNDVANACFVSKWHLSKLMSRWGKGNFYDIVNALRIEEAKKLLDESSLKVGEIGFRVGYQDTPHFARVFKSHVGISANEYRNRSRRAE